MAHILIVDDESSQHLLWNFLLKEHSVKNAMNVTEGLEMFHDITQEKFDLIITDLEMPDFDGYELIKKIRSDITSEIQDGKNVPIILATATLESHEGGYDEVLKVRRISKANGSPLYRTDAVNLSLLL